MGTISRKNLPMINETCLKNCQAQAQTHRNKENKRINPAFSATARPDHRALPIPVMVRLGRTIGHGAAIEDTRRHR